MTELIKSINTSMELHAFFYKQQQVEVSTKKKKKEAKSKQHP